MSHGGGHHGIYALDQLGGALDDQIERDALWPSAMGLTGMFLLLGVDDSSKQAGRRSRGGVTKAAAMIYLDEATSWREVRRGT
jgi:hypothetical protein